MVGKPLRIFISLLLIAPVAQGARLSFDLVTREGAKLAGGQVCFFPSKPNSSTPYDRWLWSNDVRCFAADKIVAVPSGRWNVFARHADGWITAHPGDPRR